MGNTDIALPADKVISTTDKTIGIPTATSPLKSRSGLKNENDRSPGVYNDALNDRTSTRIVKDKSLFRTKALLIQDIRVL